MQVGDVLLVRGEGKLSDSLVAAQKVIYKDSAASHVEFSIGDGTFVHATNDGGVHLTFILDELENCKEDWRAIRLKGLTQEQRDELSKSGVYYLRQDYNKVFMGSGNETSSFCSELVAKIYNAANINILDKRLPSKVTPAHFDIAADKNNDWEDVTEEYKNTLIDIRKDPMPYKLAYMTLKQVLSRRHRHSKIREGIYAHFEDIAGANGNSNLTDMISEAKDMLKERKLSFWDENDHK